MFNYLKSGLFIFILVLFFCFIFGSGQAKALVTDDLELTGITVSPAPSLNYEVTVKVSVKNSGENPLTTLTGLSSYNYTFDNFELSSVSLPSVPIEVNATGFYEIKGRFNKIGYTRLYFTVNTGSELAERTQSNNYKSVNVDVVSSHDLSAGVPVIDPLYPAVGQECTITVAVKNGGKFDLTSNYGVNSYSYQFPDFKETSKTIPDITVADKLETGSAVDFIFIGSFTSSGTKELVFKVDKDDLVEESSETNNESTKSVTIGAADAVDLKVDSIKFSKNKDELIKDDIITITASITNLSDYGLVSDTGLLERNYGWSTGGDYELIIPGIEITKVTHTAYPTPEAPLIPKAKFTYTFTGTVKDPGTGTVNFAIDIHNTLSETDETNNSISDTYTIYESLEALYDYTITGVEVEFYGANKARLSWRTDGHSSDGYVMYKNQGYGEYDRFLLSLGLDEWPDSLNKTEHSVDLPGLSPGTVYLYSIKAENDYVTKEYGVKSFTAPANNSVSFVSGPAAAVGHESAEIKWGTNLLTVGTLYYKLAGAAKYTENTSPLNSAHAVTIDKLATGTYEYYITASSTAGTKAQSPAQGFTVLGAAPAPASGAAETGPGRGTTGSSEAQDAPAGSGEAINTAVKNQSLYARLRGKIMLKVEDLGKAYYINPVALTKHYLGRPADAFSVMREQGIGIANANLEKIPVGLTDLSGVDSDGDGLSDMFEDAIGTNKARADTDGDGFNDKDELLGGYNPKGAGNINTDGKFTSDQHGKIFLQVEGNGEAWYVNPADSKRYFLGRPGDAFSVMRNLGLGISNSDFDSL